MLVGRNLHVARVDVYCIKATLSVSVFAVAVTMSDEDGTLSPKELAVNLPQGFSLNRSVSLSSRRLTAPVMRTIAMALDLPATGSKEETLQIVERNLATRDMKPWMCKWRSRPQKTPRD